MSTAAVSSLLEKIASKDKDFRYMATSDLLNELSKDNFRVDPELEKKLCSAVAVQLEDQSGDISGLAVKCLGKLVCKAGEPRVLDMIGGLCDKVLIVKKDQSRDIANIGLKTVIAEIHGASLAAAAAAKLSHRLLSGIQSKESYEVVGDSLELMTDLLARFGGLLAADQAAIAAAVLPHLDDSRAIIRKRALHCLGALAPHLRDAQLSSVVSHVLSRLEQPGLKPEVAHTYIQAVGQISRGVGYRFGPYLGQALPLVVRYCREAKEGDDELREYCLQALEGFLIKSPGDAKPYLDEVLAVALQYLRHDPNYADDMDEDGGSVGSEDDEDDDGSEEEYSDDEDVSWKVRRAAAKTLAAAVAAYPDLLASVYGRCAGELVGRFREREENVKVDVFATYCDLVNQVGAVSSRYPPCDPSSPLELLRGDVSGVIKAAAKQLGDRKSSLKTRVGVFSVLQALVGVLPEAVASDISLLTPGMLAALKDKSSSSSSLKIEALTFLRSAMEANDPTLFQGVLPELGKALFAAAQERYYKVSAEALRVCSEVVWVLRPAPGAAVPPQLSPLCQPLFSSVNERLGAQDQDQEVKEAAILCMARVVATLGDVLSGEVSGVLKVLLDRLRNEVTRLAAVKAFTIIATSPLNIPLDGVLESVQLELVSFLRKANRPLRQASLSALDALAAKSGSQLAPSTISAAVEEAAGLISDADLSLTALALKLLCTLLQQQQAAAGPVVAEKALPAALGLVRSPLLQGSASQELQVFFPALGACSVPKARPEELLDLLLQEGAGVAAGAGGGGKQAQHSVAQAVAVLSCSSGGGKRLGDTVERLLTMAKSRDVAPQRLALLSLGEIGRRADLSTYPTVASCIQAALDSDSEDIKAAASVALGGITSGHLEKYLPSLLQQVAAAAGKPKQQYLLLQALNEVVVSVSSSSSSSGEQAVALTPDQLQDVLALLLGTTEGEEECRNVLAECLGGLALLYPVPVLQALQQHLGSAEGHMRTVVVGAVKHMVTDKAEPVDAVLQDCLLDFLKLMGDPDRHVRRAAVVALSAVAHHKPQLVVQHLPGLLPLLYDQTVVKPELVRTVDLGPFKHQIDDGLELRKSAFECLDILLEAAPGALDRATFLTHLKSGLSDHVDVKAPTHLMLAKLASSSPGEVLAQLEQLAEPLEKTLTMRLKSDSVKQEIDRHEDMLRSCLRAVDALYRIPGAMNGPTFSSFMKRVVLGGALKDRFAAVQKEQEEAEVGAADAMDMS